MQKNNDLRSIYKRVQNEKNLLADDDKSVVSNTGKENVFGNAISLRLSTEASIQLLREAKP